jgi:hypothetical protein
MLVISNGAMKSGSTWLTAILLRLVDHKPLPCKFHDERFGAVPTIKWEFLEEFLDTVDYAKDTYITKNHFYYERELLARHSNVYLLDIERDLADTLVSMFFHVKKKLSAWGEEDRRLDDIVEAYWRFGPDMTEDLVRYHAVWRSAGPWAYVSSYERLKTDPASEITAIAKFLGVALAPEKLERIIEETQFGSLSKTMLSASEGMFARFRKGEIGDHRNYFGDEILDDIRRIEAENINYPATEEEKAGFARKCAEWGGRNHAFPREPNTYRQSPSRVRSDRNKAGGVTA